MSAEINASIQQQTRTGAIREIQIVGGKEVRIVKGLKSRQQVYNVSLLALGDKSHLRLHIAWQWFWGIIISVLALLGYSALKSSMSISLGGYEFIYITLFSVTALISVILFGLNLSRKRVFVSRNAQVPLFDMLVGKPDNQAYKEFKAALREHINQARSFWNLKKDQQVAGEMKMLRRLASENIISQRDYEQAKNKLFSIKRDKIK